MINKIKKESAIIWLSCNHHEKNRTVLNKILFFIDAISYFKSSKTITGDDYIKMPYGPVPALIRQSREMLLMNNYITEKLHNMGNYNEYGYLVTSGDVNKVRAEFDDDELGIIDSAIETLSTFSATQLSDISHQFEPWKSSTWESRMDLDKITTDNDFRNWLTKLNLI